MDRSRLLNNRDVFGSFFFSGQGLTKKIDFDIKHLFAPRDSFLIMSSSMPPMPGRQGRRRRHEEKSLRAVNGDSPRVGDLVGLLTSHLRFLGRGPVEEDSTQSHRRDSRTAEKALRS